MGVAITKRRKAIRLFFQIVERLIGTRSKYFLHSACWGLTSKDTVTRLAGRTAISHQASESC